MVRRLAFLNQRRNSLIDVNQLAKSKIKAAAAILEQGAILPVSVIRKIDLAVMGAWNRLPVQIFTAVTNMRRDFELIAFPHLIFIAPLIAGRSASVAAKNIATHIAACMSYLAGVNVSAVIDIIFYQITVALYLAFYRGWGLAKIVSYAADRMLVVEAVFDLSAVFKSEVRTFYRR